MNFIQEMHEKASSLKRHLLFPEGTEERTLKAATIILQKKIAAKITLLGNPDRIRHLADKHKLDISGFCLIDHSRSDHRESYTQEYYELRKHKGISEEQAFQAMQNPLYWSAMMLRRGEVDLLVAGAENSTADLLRACFTIVGARPGIRSVSSCFVMIMDDTSWGQGGKMIFSDCAIIPDPSAEQLADIGEAAAESCRLFLDCEPVVAMLSYSTKGSAESDAVQKVRRATEILRNRQPKLLVDGEMQADAALIPSVGLRKAPDSEVAGRANTLVFPDIQSGNIGYKLVQRLAKAEAIGPILQGMNKPVSDLSRGASVQDIVHTSALTIIQSQDK